MYHITLVSGIRAWNIGERNQFRGAERMYISKEILLMLDEKKLNINSVDEPVWFAMSATFGRTLKAKTFLESKQVKCFVPMRYEMVKDKTRGKIRKFVPAINNLIFVYTTKERIQALKSDAEYLQYLTKPVSGKNIPITVPEYQMQQFM